MTDKLPTGLIASTLNAKGRRIERGFIDKDTVPRMHVSSLIKSSKQDFFCEREFVLRHMERRELAGSGIPPKFALLYAVGHFYGDYTVQQFLARNAEWAVYAWGDWSCPCRHSKRERVCMPTDSCKRCKLPINQYVEVDLFNPTKTVVGHADLIFFYNGIYYVYEFKSIDRADIVFTEITQPLGDHLIQASNYFYMLKGEGKRVDPLVRFVYVDRSMSDLYTALPFREVSARAIPASRLSKFYKRANHALAAIEKGVLPKIKCESIDCSRAKQCTVAISCFSRKRTKIKRVPDAFG
jgi:hypothetical protein